MPAAKRFRELHYGDAGAGSGIQKLVDMAIIQQMLEESQEELQQILDQIQALFNQIVAIIQSKTDTGNLIVENMNHMV